MPETKINCLSIDGFIKDEIKAMSEKVQGHFYPDNHHVIKPDFKKNLKKLDPQVIEDYYYHSMRVSNFPVHVTEESFPYLLKAYDRVTMLFLEGARYPVNRFSAFEGFFLFGYNRMVEPKTPLANISFTTYQERIEFFKKPKQFTSIPGILGKLDKFKDFAANKALVEHSHLTLRNSNFLHNGIYSSDFFFWALMILVMLTPSKESEKTIELFKSAVLPDQESHHEIYQRFSTALKRKS
jgi:hypothetical protein